jgi:hypothetical protein
MARSTAQHILDFGSISGCQNSLHLSKNLRIVIRMETGEFILQASEQLNFADCQVRGIEALRYGLASYVGHFITDRAGGVASRITKMQIKFSLRHML